MIPNAFTHYTVYLPEFLTGFVISLLLTPILGLIARKYNILDLPSNMRKKDDTTAWRRIHTEPKPLLGGLAVTIPFLLITLATVQPTKYFLGFITGILLLSICGVLDDIFQLSSKLQALFQISAAFLVTISGLQILSIRVPFISTISLEVGKVVIHGSIRYILAVIVTVCWLFFIINAVKWVSGSDGLVEGNGAISALILALLSVRFQTHDTAVMGFALSGGFLGLLFFNFYPSKILSGSTGKSVYGFLLGVLAIYSGGKLATIILTLSLPILDAIWVLGYRMYKHRPKTPLQLFAINDRSHIHHKLLDIGFSQKQVAFAEYTYTLCAGSLAILLTGMHKALAICIVVLILIGCYLLIGIYKKRGQHSV